MKEEAIMKDHVNTAMEIRDSINLLRDRLDTYMRHALGLLLAHAIMQADLHSCQNTVWRVAAVGCITQ